MANEDINDEIRKADFQGKKSYEIKPLYIKRNAINISLDMDVFRIFQAPFFLEDVKKSEISLVSINPVVLQDRYENPLLNREFLYENGVPVSLNGIIENYFGLSWTEEEKDEKWRWDAFTHSQFGVRIKVSLSEFMHELTNVKDEFFMHHYFVGKVEYYDEIDIDVWLANSHYSDFLDTIGHNTAMSLMVLRSDFEEEKEIRILYDYRPQDSAFMKNEVKITGTEPYRICKHPFNWNSIVKEVLIDSRMNVKDFESYKESLTKAGLTCKIERSEVVFKKSSYVHDET